MSKCNNKKKEECFIHIGMHKTGSSSIQESLNKLPTTSNFHYIKLDSPNHGGNIYTLFSSKPQNYHAWIKLGLSKDEINEIKEKTKSKLIESFTTIDSNRFFISGEDIINLEYEELLRLKDFFSDYFKKITIIGYVRTPKTYIKSAFQQSVKGKLNHFNLSKLYPNYKSRFEKFDNVFDKKNVILRPFNKENLYGNSVVSDIAKILNIEFNESFEKRTNDSLSLEAVQLLYIYRKFGPSYGTGKNSIRENNTLIKSLSTIGKTKFEISDSLINPILEKNRNDISWITNRLDLSEFDTHEENDNHTVKNELDLLTPKTETINELLFKLGEKFHPNGLTPSSEVNVALLVHSLRLKLSNNFNRKINHLEEKTRPLEIENSITFGKDGFIFLTGGNHQIKRHFTKSNTVSNTNINTFYDNIKFRKKICETNNSHFQHFIFPEKLYLSRDKANEKTHSIYLENFTDQSCNKNITYLLLSHKSSFKFNHKTDTHFNLFGNLEALKEIINNDSDVDEYIHKVKENTYIEFFSGDLGTKTKPNTQELKVNYRPFFSYTREHNGLTGGNNGIIDIVINKDALYDKKLLIFGDSFFRSLLPHLTYFYKDIMFFRTGNFHNEIFKIYKPDLVFTGNAERYLTNVNADSYNEDFFSYLKSSHVQHSPSNEFELLFRKRVGYKYSDFIDRFNISSLGGSNSLLSYGIKSGLSHSKKHKLYEFSVGGSSSIQNLHSIIKNTEKIKSADLVISESNVNDSFSIFNLKESTKKICDNINSYYKVLSSTNNNVLVLILPLNFSKRLPEDKDTFKKVNDCHLENIFKYGLDYVDLSEEFDKFSSKNGENIYNYLMNDARHPKILLMHELCKNISNHYRIKTKYKKQFLTDADAIVNDYKVLHSTDLSENAIIKSNRRFKEKILFIDNEVSIPSNFEHFELLGVSTWGEGTMSISNKNKKLTMNFNELFSFNEIFDFTIDKETKLSFCTDTPNTRTLNCQSHENIDSFVGIESLLLRKNKNDRIKTKFEINKSSTKPRKLNHLIPNLELYLKDSFELLK